MAGARLTPAQLAHVAYSAGFRGDALRTAVAVAMAESSGQTGASNPVGEDSRGLWQINVNGSTSWGRARLAKYGNLYDPYINAKAAFDISGGGKNFGAWTTYAGSTAAGARHGYRQYLDDADAGIAEASGNPRGLGSMQVAPTSGGWTVGGSGTSSGARTSATSGTAGLAQSGITGESTIGQPIPTAGGTGTPRTGVVQLGGGAVRIGLDGSLTPATERSITPQSSPEEIDAYVRENYPQLVGLLNVPELRTLLMDAAVNDWDDYEFAGKLAQTTWWQNTTPATRQFLALAGADPAAAEKNISDVQGTIRTRWQEAGGFGGPSSEWLIRTLAQDSITQGLTPEEVNQRMIGLIRNGDPNDRRDLAQGDEADRLALASGDRNQIGARVRAIFTNAGVQIGTAQEGEQQRIDRIVDDILGGRRQFDDIRVSVDAQKPAVGPGTISATADGLLATARDYLVPLDKRTTEDWAFRIAAGTATEDGFRSYVAGLSKGRFASDPTVTAFIESGGTPGQYFASHRQTVAGLLEISPDQIDLLDPKWMELTETVQKDGTRRAPTLAEAASWARHKTEFGTTRRANEQSFGLADELLRTFGALR